MLMRQFKGSAKLFLGLLIVILICTLYIEYKSRTKRTSFTVLGNQEKVKAQYKLIIVVFSAPSNVEQREAVRGTWLSENYEDVKYLFVIGTQNMEFDQRNRLASENKAYHDLLLLPNLQDSYQALTKKLLHSFAHICKEYDFDYLLKCDDDSFVLVDKILKEFEKQRYEALDKELYWGFFNGKAQVKRSGPWKETDWIFCDFYLPYARGGGYVLSQNLVKFIAQNSNILRLFNSEDVSVGLWLAPLSNIERKHDVRFDTEYRSRGCSNEHIIKHKQNVEAMNTMYQTYKASGALCVKEVRYRNSYRYDWGVPPSRCCIRELGIP
ncbi:beta-1,3-galactosyltransferase 6 [Neodiprion virginianus]|uniref:beta-1,3-galactosyltransferase 6 n=1 Tax=Neodiprion virginianus TaxID=2961670 RepID=UPI001EE7236B|nr:beta-1,3-galactosyltransferase 6 [Neodiprion virginianus]